MAQALGNPCPTEMEEIRAYKGDFHRAYDDGGTRHRAVEEVANTKLDHKRMLRHLSNNKYECIYVRALCLS